MFELFGTLHGERLARIILKLYNSDLIARAACSRLASDAAEIVRKQAELLRKEAEIQLD